MSKKNNKQKHRNYADFLKEDEKRQEERRQRKLNNKATNRLTNDVLNILEDIGIEESKKEKMEVDTTVRKNKKKIIKKK